MLKVQSADGTTIAVDQTGSGPAVILIGGAFNDQSTTAGLAAALAPSFTVYNPDRRGRGGSGDTRPYAVAREVEDVAAIIEAAGGQAALFGHSSGAVLALEAVMAGLPVTRVAGYEPAYVAGTSRGHAGADLAGRVQALADAGQRDEATALFLTEGVGVAPEFVQQMQAAPMWAGLAALAHTLPYDIALTRPDQGVPAARLGQIRIPALVVGGSDTTPFLLDACHEVAAAIPHAEEQIIHGEDHAVLARPDVLVPVLTGFLAG
jgi:pimeloyl-ACP methyl ester carboxylesterase